VLPLRDLRIEAAKMVNRGLDRDVALRALTVVPAKILGMEDEMGAVKVGARADLVVWEGDPLDVAGARVRHAVVGGKLLSPPVLSTGDFHEVLPYP